MKRLAVGKTVREGDLARVWDGKRWRDGRIRRVSYPETPGRDASTGEVEIQFEGCPCGPAVQRGQCRHRFRESDCGRTWLRDCPAQRRQRRHQERQAALQASEARERIACCTATHAETAKRSVWPTAKLHQQLNHGKRKHKDERGGGAEDGALARPRDLPVRRSTDQDQALAPAAKRVTVGRRLPEWRLRQRPPAHRPEREDVAATTHQGACGDRREDRLDTGLCSSDESTNGEDGSAHHQCRRRVADDDDDAGDLILQEVDNQPAASHADDDELAQMQNQSRRHEDNCCGEQEQRKGKNRRRKEMLRRQRLQQHGDEEMDCIGSRSPPRVVLELEAYEWVRVEARGVLWVEEGPAQLVLRPGERIVSGPHQRLDLPITSFSSTTTSSFLFTPSSCPLSSTLFILA